MKAVVLVATALLAGALCVPTTVHAEPPAAAATTAVASRCAASVEEAARGILGSGSVASAEGYRVQDLFIDPVLGKAFVRVADCHDARKPLTLVPVAASLAAGNRQTSPGAPATAAVAGPGDVSARSSIAGSTPSAGQPPLAAAAPLPAAPILIARGDSVDVLVQSANVRMRLSGHAASAAAAGEPVDVMLDAAPATANEPATPPHHMHGIAAGPHRVEVQR